MIFALSMQFIGHRCYHSGAGCSEGVTDGYRATVNVEFVGVELSERDLISEALLGELQDALDAMQSGRAGAAGKALLDPRLLEKPRKIHGR